MEGEQRYTTGDGGGTEIHNREWRGNRGTQQGVDRSVPIPQQQETLKYSLMESPSSVFIVCSLKQLEGKLLDVCLCHCFILTSVVVFKSLLQLWKHGGGRGGGKCFITSSTAGSDGVWGWWGWVGTTQKDHTWLISSIWLIRNGLAVESLLLTAIPSCTAYSLPENDRVNNY